MIMKKIQEIYLQKRNSHNLPSQSSPIYKFIRRKLIYFSFYGLDYDSGVSNLTISPEISNRTIICTQLSHA